MDRNTVLAVILMVGIFFIYTLYQGTQTEKESLEQQVQNEKLENQSGVSSTTFDSQSSAAPNLQGNLASADSIMKSAKLGVYFSQFADGSEQVIEIENDVLTAKISNKGATVKSWILKDYTQYNGKQSQLIWFGDKQLFQEFLSMDGKLIDSRELFFSFDSKKNKVKLTGDEQYSFKAYLKWDEGHYIERSYTFYGNKYHLNTSVKLVNLDEIIRGDYNFNWEGGLKYQEKNTVDESNESEALLVMGDEPTSVDASDIEEDEKLTLTGNFNYAGLKNKYFAAAIQTENFDGSIDVVGKRYAVKNEGFVEKYDVSLKVPYRGGTSEKDYLVYIGPIKPKIVEEYGFGRLVNYGWWIFRYIGQLFVFAFKNINALIGNWGFTIIIFSVILKFMLYPLTRPQMRSMQKMKALAPVIEKAKAKFPDDTQKQQQETMKIYGEYGVNPLGGCLPMLLQMPILYTLWAVFRSNISLRQTVFIPGWINDLSVPDTIIDFGVSIMGISSISGLALAMGVTMFIQQKMSVTDPRQKAMIYMMPVMFTLMFSNFPAGLNLYYFTFNLIGIGQQIYMQKFAKNKITIDSMKRGPKKEGWLQKKMKEAQALAEQQQQLKQNGSSKPNMQKYQHNPKRRDTKSKKKK